MNKLSLFSKVFELFNCLELYLIVENLVLLIPNRKLSLLFPNGFAWDIAVITIKLEFSIYLVISHILDFLFFLNITSRWSELCVIEIIYIEILIVYLTLSLRKLSFHSESYCLFRLISV